MKHLKQVNEGVKTLCRSGTLAAIKQIVVLRRSVRGVSHTPGDISEVRSLGKESVLQEIFCSLLVVVRIQS